MITGVIDGACSNIYVYKSNSHKDTMLIALIYHTFSPRIALVTGGNRGLGFEICRQLSKLGLSVILTARDINKGKAASKRLSDKGLDVLSFRTEATLIALPIK